LSDVITADEVLAHAAEIDKPAIDALVQPVSLVLLREWRHSEVIVTVNGQTPSVVDGMVEKFRESGWLIRRLHTSTAADGTRIEQLGFNRAGPQFP